MFRHQINDLKAGYLPLNGESASCFTGKWVAAQVKNASYPLEDKPKYAAAPLRTVCRVKPVPHCAMETG